VSKEGNIRKRVFPVIFMLAITLVFISITTVIYTYTKDTIKFQESLRLKRSILYAAGVNVPSDPQKLQAFYLKNVEEVKDNKGTVLYYAVKGKNPATIMSYVIVVTGAGLWGQITLAVGYDKNGKDITGMEVISQNETPGLGGRIAEAWFKEQFRGKQAPLSYVPEGGNAGPNQFQAITGATYTTTAIMDTVNKASKEVLAFLKKKKQ
jgi:Na+-transporting NADH:ubiquinone oxidoreductase subunit C